MKTINDVFIAWQTGGIFTALASLSPAPPWGSDSTKASQLDFMYHGNWSGSKTISPLVENVLNGDETLSSAKINILAGIINTMYGKHWSRMYEVYTVDYEPIENYSMEEKHTGTETQLKTPTNWKTSHSGTDTETQTPLSWQTVTEGIDTYNNAESNNSVYGFNSSSPVPASQTSTEQNNKQTTTQSGTYEKEIEYDTEEVQSGTFEDKMTYNTTLERSGNIGVTTSQQMLESEITLWKWEYFEDVFKTIDKVLTLCVYE